MAPKDDDLKTKARRKLTKKNKNPHRMPSTHIPERLRGGEDEDEDVTAPNKAAPTPAQYMNRSVFSMIAAAGSRTNFNARFDESSDSEDDETESKSTRDVTETEAGKDNDGGDASVRTIRPVAEIKNKAVQQRGKKLSTNAYAHVLPKIPFRSASLGRSRSRSRSAREERESSRERKPRGAPMLSRMLTAQAELGDTGVASDNASIPVETELSRSRTNSSPASMLATRLMEIFGLEKPEKVVAEYPCWLLQSVLLQGYMYITEKHICFYAYLPKKSNVVAKTGYLSKRGRQNPRYNRYWFTLKGDVLSYYANPSDVYFPHGNIDLRYGISAALAGPKEKQKDTKDFTVVAAHRTYCFRADSTSSAREWVKTLQKVIFRSHNDGDSVKISLPVENVIDIEDSPVVDFAETFKIRVIESGDSYAIDEYFFSFFSAGKEALDDLNKMISDTPAQRISKDLVDSPTEDDAAFGRRARSPGVRKSPSLRSHSDRARSATPLRDSVRATLAPPASEDIPRKLSGDIRRASGEFPMPNIDSPLREYSRASFDGGRRSGSTSRVSLHRERQPPKSPLNQKQGSSDSFVQSLDKETDSSMAVHSATTDAPESASQILAGSEVFHSPTVNRLQDLQSADTEDTRRASVDTPRFISAKALPERRKSENTPVTMTDGAPVPAQALPVDPESGQEGKITRKTSSPNLQDILKASAYPLQRAAGLAGYLKSRSTRMSRLLATESMGYVEKVSGMWQGGHKHYGANEGLMPDDRTIDAEDEEASVGHGDRFRAHFALPATEKLQATYFGYLHRVLPLYGKIYVSNQRFCFRSLLPGTKTKLILPLKDIENVNQEKGFRFGYHGLVLVIRGHEELFFEFNSSTLRDDCAITLLENLSSIKFMAESELLAQQDREEAEIAKAENEKLQEARREPNANREVLSGLATPTEPPTILFDDPRASIINFKPTQSLHITCLTIGSRGDVQPYIALCKGFLAEGHKPRIATHAEFEPWVRKHGIDFRSVDGNPAELMRICVENGMFTYSFLREASSKFRHWIDELLSSAWAACQDTEVLIESPSAMAGIHIAEALEIPYFRAFTMPWTRTRAYPHAFVVPEHKIGGAYNYFSYVMFDNVFWKAIAGQVNRWRKKELGLRSTNLDKMQPNKVPFLYNFSPSVVPPPLDYSDWVRVTGFWFLDEGVGWTPPEDITNFIAKARKDGKKLVYIGFGSIVVSDPAALTRTVVESVKKADVRCILSKGWSDRLGDPKASKAEMELPEEILQIKSAPHDWLFKQIDAAVHHGGAGTTGASLRAGLPTIVKPFFGDQFFFGGRVEDLGVGICLKKVNVSGLGRALWEASNSERMRKRAALLGEKIRSENGVENAIQAIYRDLDYAKSLIKRRRTALDDAAADDNNNNNKKASSTTLQDDDAWEGIEESWTFIGDDSDPDLKRKIAGWNPALALAQARLRASVVAGAGVRSVDPES